MPIRINLLAEAQAAEEDRRKDPVKRGAYIAGCLVVCVSLWALTLQFKLMTAKGAFNTMDVKWKSIEKSYQAAVIAQKSSIAAEQKLAALHQMTTNRFLYGNVMNAFQHTLGSMDDVQVTKFKAEQFYTIVDGTPNRTNGTTVVPGKPATSTEKISITVDAMDLNQQAGLRVNQFKESMAKVPFFKDNLNSTNGVMLMSRSAPQSTPNGRQSFVMFSLRANFPEKTR